MLRRGRVGKRSPIKIALVARHSVGHMPYLLRLFGALLVYISTFFYAGTSSAALSAESAESPSQYNWTREERKPLRLGILAYLGNEAAEHSWKRLEQHLETALPQYRVQIHYGDLDALRRQVATGALDFVLTNPGQYVELEYSDGASRIATLEHGQQAASNIAVGAAVIVPRERIELQTLADLQGRSLAVTSADAFGGFQTAWRELAELGIDPQRDLRSMHFTGFPMPKVIAAIDEGLADAGVIRACLLESLPDGLTRYRVLSGRYETQLNCTISTRLYPNWPMAGLPHTPPAMARAMAIALLQMEADTDGMSWAVPADYQIVRDTFRELQIGPYAHLHTTGLRRLVHKYWPYGMLVLLGLLFWGLYTARSEYLVRTRTAALEQALREREAFEQRLRANQEQADHLARLSVLGELSSTLAHELSQPLAGIANYAQSLLRRLHAGRLTDAAVHEASENILTLSDSAAGILKRIKGFARKRSGSRKSHELHKLVDETIQLFKGVQRLAPKINVISHLTPGRRVEIDALQIQQILMNFFKNAQDAMQGLPAEQQQIQVTLKEDEWVWLHVRDFGPGMNADALEYLFEPFYTTKEDGLGLGLSICKGIAEAHGGQLFGRACPDGRGMIFSLSLPLYEHDTKFGDLSDR